MKTNAHKVRLHKHIHAGFGWCSEDVDIYRDIALPLAPFVGLQVEGKDWLEQIAEVVVCLPKGEIHAHIQADKEIYDAVLHGQSHRTLDEVVKEYTSTGWRIKK